MIINKQTIVAIGDVVSIKLSSGEEIVGRLSEQGIDTVTLTKPVTISLQPVSAKQMGLTFLPVMGSVDPETTLTIAKSAMAIRPVRTNQSITSSYLEMTTGLVTSASSGLVL